MGRTVLDVGNCSVDFGAISGMLRDRFQADVMQAHGPHDTLESVRQGNIDLVLVNRKLDQDYSDGIEIIRLLKTTPETAHIPVMLVTNYEDHQAAAVALGALPGFGKKTLYTDETQARLATVLS